MIFLFVWVSGGSCGFFLLSLNYDGCKAVFSQVYFKQDLCLEILLHSITTGFELLTTVSCLIKTFKVSQHSQKIQGSHYHHREMSSFFCIFNRLG